MNVYKSYLFYGLNCLHAQRHTPMHITQSLEREDSTNRRYLKKKKKKRIKGITKTRAHICHVLQRDGKKSKEMNILL